MKKTKKYTLFFLIGGVGYAVIELLWRGRTHWSMMIAGGICFITFSLIAERFRDKPIIYKAVIASLCITTVELIFGIIFNIILKMNVWNYSSMPFNLFGQICPLYSVLWLGLSLIFLPVAALINQSFDKSF